MVCSTSTGAFCSVVAIYHFFFVIPLFPSLPQFWPTWLSDSGGREVCWERTGWRGEGGGGGGPGGEGGGGHTLSLPSQAERSTGSQAGRKTRLSPWSAIVYVTWLEAAKSDWWWAALLLWPTSQSGTKHTACRRKMQNYKLLSSYNELSFPIGIAYNILNFTGPHIFTAYCTAQQFIFD